MNFELTGKQTHVINGNDLGINTTMISAGIDMSKLIGHPHLFGRIIDIRNGFLIDPIGVLTMQPDGRITGYSHPNEGSWMAYEHGTVAADKAFTFINAHNSWIPSSTWEQSYGDIAVGYFCNEYEGIKKLCLIPHEVSTKKKRIVYLVASCYNFFIDGRTIPNLLDQLFAEGIEPDRIKVVVNGCEANENKDIDGISYAFSMHNAWEWSTLYEAPLRWNFDYGMLIHDTNRILPGFRRKVEEFNDHLHWDYLPATPNAACLIGLYSHDFLKRLNPWLKSIDNIDKRNGVLAEVAGELLLRAQKAIVMGDPERGGGSRPAEWREIVDVYNTGSPRHRRVFPSIGLHKFIHAGGQPSNAKSL